MLHLKKVVTDAPTHTYIRNLKWLETVFTLYNTLFNINKILG